MLQSHQPQADIDAAVWDILEDERKVIPELLPNTGINAQMEELLSSIFIQSPVYGTRCSNFLQMKAQQWLWQEKNQQGVLKGKITSIEQSMKP